MANDEAVEIQAEVATRQPPTFEGLLRCAPVLESLLLQLPTQSILALYHTSSKLRQFLQSYPTSWKYLSFRLNQPAQVTLSTANNNGNVPPQSSNYTLDQLILYLVLPFSTCLTSLELDNTAVCGTVLISTVLHMRRDTLEHLSVRGCKNVSLKYHINPWLKLFGRVNDVAGGAFAPAEFQKLALKSLYTYRCRHHRRRPYLPTSLTRKDSDSEPTHYLVNLCHELGIWTDTAWCTTPGARCYRRRGYVTMRVPQDPREVWVVYDRLWRSRNWIGATEHGSNVATDLLTRKRKRDCRSWEHEEGIRGEALGTGKEGKSLPAHLRKTHRQFVEDISCDNCSAVILERCEQCSVTMHCAGCRKTLCASCAFDRPYLRNRNTDEDDADKFWWAPGCIISPCSMQDQDPTPIVPGTNPTPPTNNTGLPNSKFKWCCTEPIFSGGGGITFGPGSHPDHDQIRAAPLLRGRGWEDGEFLANNKLPWSNPQGPAGRWNTIDSLFRRDDLTGSDQTPPAIPRNLCDDCHSSDQWKVRCKACSLSLCLKHDVRDKLRVRICGYKDLLTEKHDFRARQKVVKLKTTTETHDWKACNNTEKSCSCAREEQKNRIEADPSFHIQTSQRVNMDRTEVLPTTPAAQGISATNIAAPTSTQASQSNAPRPSPVSDGDLLVRPSSPGSNSTAAPSRSSSPTPSLGSNASAPNSSAVEEKSPSGKDSSPEWRGCQFFICPPNRAPGDHRRRCVAIVRQCLECKVNVCGDCVASMEPSCPCKGCRLAPAEGAPQSPSVDGIRFFCPNCRWDRRQSGKCKRRVATSGDPPRNRRKDRYRKPLAERKTAINPSNVQITGPGYDDEIVEMVGEFLESLGVLEAPTLLDQANALRDETVEEIRELEDMGALARDLVRRIQRLRDRFRPGPLAEAALPTTRLEEATDLIMEPDVGQVPVVEDMD